MKNKLLQRILQGSFWSFWASFSYSVCTLIASWILARVLGKEIYGQYSFIRSTINTMIVFSTFSLGVAATKYIAEFRERRKKKVGRIIDFSLISVSSLSAISILFVMCFAELISRNFVGNACLASTIRLSSCMIFFAAINGVLVGVLMGLESFKKIAYVNIIGGGVLICLSFILSHLFGLNGAVLALIIQMLVMMVTYAMYTKEEMKKNGILLLNKLWIKEYRIVTYIGLPTALSGLLCSLTFWLGSVALTRSSGFAVMGGYDVILQWKMTVLFIPGVIAKIILPVLSNINAKKDASSFFYVVKINILLNFVLCLLITCVLSCIGKWILLFYGAHYVVFYTSFVIIIMTTTLCAVNNVIGQVILSKGYAWVGFFMNCLWSFVFLLCVWIFVLHCTFSILGIAISFSISYFVHTVVQFPFLIYISRKNG